MPQKTQDELEDQLASLRVQVRELETELLALEGADKRSSPRRLETVSVQFVAELDVVDAEGIDRSDEGVQLALSRPMRFNLRLEEDEEHVARSAELVWSRRQPDGWTRMGFQFVEAHPSSAF
ncbi:MAG: PilZ domain-containing protein [bacterium]|nr:PilZ domain-containing protein [bacterium]